ncbi:MAG: hypothetical protein NXI16_07185 [Alphaproteobacteria bacterium]|nr:hypothetical protein [Alphaproteobacteria bacterium]
MKDDPLLKLSDAERIAWAKSYPFDPPRDGYVYRHGEVHPITPDVDLDGRTPVIAVGSNRGPRQLKRKYGDNAVVPVTRIEIDHADVVYSASIAPYGSVPATLYPSEGTTVHLHATWLDAPQLEAMHLTEGIGQPGGYQFGTIDLPVRCEVTGTIDRPHMYLSGRGVFWIDGGPVAFEAIQADNRRYPTLRQEEAIAMVLGRLAPEDAQDDTLDGTLDDMLDEGILKVLKHEGHRESLLNRLKDHASPIAMPGFTVIR